MEIREIIKSLSILTVLEHYHLKPNKNKMVCCPFHDDKNPSMQVYGIPPSKPCPSAAFFASTAVVAYTC